MPLKERIGRLKGGMGREWVILAASVLIAGLIWFLTQLSNVYTGTISVPVVAQCNIDGHRGTSSNTVIVSARCRTDGFRLVREHSRKEKRVVTVAFDRGDMRRTGPETFCVIGGAKNSYIGQFFGEGTTVEAFITDTLRFVFPSERHKKVPVEVPRSIHCRSQYMMSGPFRVSPDSVTVYATDEILDGIEKITSARIVMTDLHSSQHGILKLEEIPGVRMSHEEVSYEIPVSRYVELRTEVPLEVWNVPAGHQLQVYPTTASVVMRCAFPLQKDPLASFKLYIDYRDFSESLSGRCAPRTLRLPSGVLEYHVEPEVFDCVELR
ncbi:MAG: hypothetical protein IJ813_05915 [Bacteroidales bacterium]|nr:hypothetical protein [Bacteroidales bacterium]